MVENTFKYLKSFRQFLRMWWNGLHWILFMYVPYALSLCKSWPNFLSHMILFVILGHQSLVNIFCDNSIIVRLSIYFCHVCTWNWAHNFVIINGICLFILWVWLTKLLFENSRSMIFFFFCISLSMLSKSQANNTVVIQQSVIEIKTGIMSAGMLLILLYFFVFCRE